MNHNLIAKLNALEPEAAEKLGDALDRAETAEELLALLKAQGIDATEEDLVSEEVNGELSEESLEDVASGRLSLISAKLGFILGAAAARHLPPLKPSPIYPLPIKCPKKKA